MPWVSGSPQRWPKPLNGTFSTPTASPTATASGRALPREVWLLSKYSRVALKKPSGPNGKPTYTELWNLSPSPASVEPYWLSQAIPSALFLISDERRDGKDGVHTLRSRGWPDN